MPLKQPEAFEKIGIRPIKGILLVGAPGNRKDHARQGGGDREGGQLHIDKGAGAPQQVRGGEREGGQGDLQEGEDGRAMHNIHRRDRLDSAGEGRRTRRTRWSTRGSSTRCSRRWTGCTRRRTSSCSRRRTGPTHRPGAAEAGQVRQDNRDTDARRDNEDGDIQGPHQEDAARQGRHRRMRWGR